MAAGSIIVDLLMRTGSFETDTKKAQRALKQFQKDAVDTGKIIGTALAAGAITAAYAFDKLVKGAADFKDLEETTGAKAEDLASLAIAAETAGVGMETLAANSIRLTKGLLEVDDESKAAGAGIKALGLDLASFKQLDPVAQIDALTAAFAGFGDGAAKTAVATAIWGKSGAEMLKVMKALEEQGGRTKILTQDQIELADAYADAQAKSTAELKLYAQAAATQALPALSALIEETKRVIAEIIGLDETTGKLGLNTAVRDFAEGGAKWLGFFIDELRRAGADIKAFAASTKQELKAIQFAWALVTANPADLGDFLRGESGRLADLRKELTGLTKDAEAAAKAARSVVPSVEDALSKRFTDQRTSEQRLGAFSDPRSLTFGGSPRDLNDQGKKTLTFSGAADKAKTAKKEIDEVAKAIQALEEELALFAQDEAFTKAFKLEGMGATNAQLDEYRKKLAQLEELKTAAAIDEAIAALVKERDELGLTNEQLSVHKLLLQGASEEQIRYAQGVMASTKAAREQQDAMDEGKRLYQETRTPAEQLNVDISKLNDLLKRGAIDWDTYSRAVFAAQDKFEGATKKTEETVDSFTKRFAENAQDLLGQGLYDMMSGNFKNIGDAFAQMITRMVAEAAAAELARTLFGDLVKGGSGSGWLGGITSAIGSWFGGARAEGGGVDGGRTYLVGERGPELFTPRTSGAVLSSSATRSMGGSNTYNFGGINVVSNGAMDRAAEDRAAQRIARKAQAFMSRGSA
jgi:hypothetical protein